MMVFKDIKIMLVYLFFKVKESLYKYLFFGEIIEVLFIEGFILVFGGDGEILVFDLFVDENFFL